MAIIVKVVDIFVDKNTATKKSIMPAMADLINPISDAVIPLLCGNKSIAYDIKLGNMNPTSRLCIDIMEIINIGVGDMTSYAIIRYRGPITNIPVNENFSNAFTPVFSTNNLYINIDIILITSGVA